MVESSAHPGMVGRRQSRLFPVVAAVLLLWGSHSDAVAQNINVRIALSSNSFATSSIRIAEKAGLFEKNGLNAVVTPMASGNVAMSALVGGSVDFTSSNPAEILALRAQGQPVYIAGGTFRGYSPTLVLAKEAADKLADKKSANAVDKLKALNGMSLAVPSAASVYAWPLALAARTYNIKIDFVFIQQDAMPAALKAKTVQGFVAASPFWEPTVKEGYGAVWMSGPHDEFPEEILPSSTTALGVMESFMKAQPEAVKRVRAALKDTAALIKNEPGRARKALAESQPNLSPADLAAAFDLYAQAWSHPDYSLADVEHDIEVLVKANLQGMPDLTKLNAASTLAP